MPALFSVLLALAIFVVPGAAERLGWVPDDESLRIPLVFAALALGLGMPARSPSRRAVGLAILAIVPGVLALAGVAGRTPTETPISLVGAPYLPFALAAAVVVGARLFADEASRDRAMLAATTAGAVAALWIVVERVLGLPAVGPFGRAGIAGPTLAALALVAAAPLVVAFDDADASRASVARRAAVPAVIVVGVLATGSRTAMLALLAGALGLAFALRRRGAALAIVAALVAAVGVAVFTGSETLRVRVGVAKA